MGERIFGVVGAVFGVAITAAWCWLTWPGWPGIVNAMLEPPTEVKVFAAIGGAIAGLLRLIGLT